MTTKNRIEEIKKEGYHLDFGTIINNSFENYKKIALQAGIVILLLGFMACVIGVISFFSFMGSDFKNFNPESIKVENFSLLMLIVYMTVMIIFTIIFSPINGGLLKMAHNAAKNEDFSIGTAFEYYKNPYFKEIVISTLILSLFNVVLSTLLQYFNLQIAGTILSLIISFFTFLTVPFIIFGKLNAVEAIQASYIVVSKQILILLGILIVSILIAMIGFIGCCIGIIFTIPFLFSVYFCIYNEVIGIEEIDEIEQINGEF